MALKFNTFRSERYLRSRFLEGRYLLSSELSDVELELVDFSRKLTKFSIGDIAIEDSWKIEKYSIFTEITNIDIPGKILTINTTILDLVRISDEVFKNSAYVTIINSIDLINNTITVNSLGSLAVGNIIEIKLSNTLLMKEGEAWFDGVPFVMRGGRDALVSGTNLSTGVMIPSGGGNSNVTVQDEPEGLGKLITFNSTGTTPSGEYRLTISAREEIITSNDDLFLKNANIPESTAQKLRTNYRLNMAPESFQNQFPVPYVSSSDGNFVNEIKIIPQSGGNGSEVSRITISGSEQIDGRNLEIIIRNDSAAANTDPFYGGAVGNLIPNSSEKQKEFFNGKFTDSIGNIYHINAIFNDVISTQVVIRLDKEVGQPDPQIVIGQTYTLRKRDMIVTDDVNGNPQGSLYWPLSIVKWDQVLGFIHESKLTDLRSKIISGEEFQEKTNIKFGIKITQGGAVSFDVVGNSLLDWTSNISLINPYGPEQTIQTGSQAILEGGSLVYIMDLDNGGIISKGTKAVTISDITGNNITFTNPTDLTNIKVGNVLKRNTLNEMGHITEIDHPSNIVILAAGHTMTNLGPATIYLDSFGPETAPVDYDRYVMAVRRGNRVYFTGAVELDLGETNKLGGGVPEGLLTFIGATDENDDTPVYPSVTIVTQGTPLINAIGELDAEVNNILTILSGKAYDERILYPAGLASLTNITIPVNSRNAGIQETYDPTAGELEVYRNGAFVFQDEVWESVSTTQIRFLQTLPPDTEIHFRIDTLGGSGGGGGGGADTLQDAYNTGTGEIVTVGGKPFKVSGAATKVAWFTGDIQVDGIIDPSGMELSKQETSPLGSNKNGIWVNNGNELILDRDAEPQQNLSKKIEDLESGVGINCLVRSFINVSGDTISEGTPVYSPTVGQVDLADGDDTEAKARIMGIAAEEILAGQAGLIAYVGTISGAATGFIHGAYLYLSATAGTLTDTKPTIGGGFPVGFHVVKVGIVDGNDLLLQVEFIGDL